MGRKGAALCYSYSLSRGAFIGEACDAVASCTDVEAVSCIVCYGAIWLCCWAPAVAQKSNMQT